jgi:hypothetical protein
MITFFKQQSLPLALIVLISLTRFHHFGDALHLPDASLAVFFFAGFYQANKQARYALFAGLVALAGLVDAIAIASGTSAWCVSPAYAGLMPTYAVMTGAGYIAAQTLRAESADKNDVAFTLALLAVATSVAFCLSNISFFWFSGHFASMGLGDYALAVVHYYPQYLGAAVGYGSVGLLFMTFFSPMRHHNQHAC